MTVNVLNLSTGQTIVYSADNMTPVKAVVCAHHQFTLRDNNTFDYNFDTAPVKYGPSGRTVFCGDFAAMLQ